MLSTFYPDTALTKKPTSGAEWSCLALGQNESILTLHDSILCLIRSMRCVRQGDAEKCQFSQNRSQEKPRRSPCYYFSHNTGMPHFSKSSCYATLLLWKIYISTYFHYLEKKLEEDLRFYQRSRKENSICFARILTEAAGTLSSESWTHKLLSQKPHSASQRQGAIALICVCEPLCFISIYSVHSCF